MRCVKVSGADAGHYIEKNDVLVCIMRPSRNKAKRLAIFEMSALLEGAGESYILNGPLGDVRGAISFFIEKNGDKKILPRLRNAGYCNKFYKLDFTMRDPVAATEIKSINPYFWKGREFQTIRVYEEDEETYKSQSIGNRPFALYGDGGAVRHVRGYRGDGGEAGRRALPLEDARLMVNIAGPEISGALPDPFAEGAFPDPSAGNVLLDPFAGGGSILHAARLAYERVFLISADIDKTLAPGLELYSDLHFACDARELDFGDRRIGAVVTEIPFSPNYTDAVIESIMHIKDAMTRNGKISLMCGAAQFPKVERAFADMGFCHIISDGVNRKGTPVVISLWTLDSGYRLSLENYLTALRAVV